MPVTEINKVEIPHTEAGYNLTDSAGFTATGLGTGNGVKFDFDKDDLVVLKNDTGGAAAFTLKINVPGSLENYSAAVTDPTRSVADGKTYLMRLDEIFRDASGEVTIECDVAGKVLVLEP